MINKKWRRLFNRGDIVMNIQVDLTGKTALVVGGSRGIGEAISVKLAQSGAKVAVAARSEEGLNQVRQKVEAQSASFFGIVCDISDVSQVFKMIDDVDAWNGGIDLMVNSAGINIPTPALEVTEEIWDKTIDINLKGAFFCCQAVAKKMVPRKKGKIINITSQLAFVAFQGRAVYCASKSGLDHMSKVFALELAPHNIQVNCIAPTFTRTPMTEAVFNDPEAYQKVVSRIPLGRAGEPEDYTGAVLYLASDSANLVTGTTILVDGGWTIE